VSCKSKHENSQLLFNNIFFKLNKTENVVPIDVNKSNMFNSYFDKKSVQIPLFKCIRSKDYLIFLGIPYNTSVKELAEQNLSNNLNQSLFEGDSVNYFYKRYINKNEQITTYARSFKDNIVYMLTISDSAKLTDSLFNARALSNRFIK